jgi:hypothetical protein
LEYFPAIQSSQLLDFSPDVFPSAQTVQKLFTECLPAAQFVQPVDPAEEICPLSQDLHAVSE